MRKLIIATIVAIVATTGLLLGQGSQNPHGKLKWECQDCHTANSWKELRDSMNFNHEHAGFHLTGAHETAKCAGCHKTPQFNKVGTACNDCHTDQHQGQLGKACDKCHTVRNWQGRKDLLEAHAQKGFALTGVHAVADCEACHRNHTQQEYSGTPMDCVGCHEEAFNTASNPSHVGAGFTNQCDRCHHAASGTWANATYHHKTFQLVGAHRLLECGSCHTPIGSALPLYDGKSTACYSCHEPDYKGTTNPNHTQNNYDHNCAVCHSSSYFVPAQNKHNLTAFPLNGAHSALAATSDGCDQCHNRNNVRLYAGTPKDCYACHQTVFESTTNPNHVLGNFNHLCSKCHTESGWTPSTFSHNNTVFPLTGAHTIAACIACHATTYGGTPTNCYACHQTDYTGVISPNHVTGNFNHNCNNCHSTAAWLPSSFNHNNTAFPLTGAHTIAACIACHATTYGGTPTNCYACHQTDFAGVIDPNHVTNNFDHVCTTCHTTTAWIPSSFKHNSTAFPLTGAHTIAPCIACHATGYAGTSSACYSCHQTDFAGVVDPNHVTNNFSHVCSSCHSTTAWVPSSFNHAGTAFPLTGAHTAATCVACHATGYTNTPTTCVSCHQTDYTGTTTPNHAAANFPNTCQTCHTTTAWTPSTWNHETYFPIKTGTHASVWSSCATCHNVPSNYAAFECINCHTHSRANTDGRHAGENGYQYLSTACYRCHPRGRA